MVEHEKKFDRSTIKCLNVDLKVWRKIQVLKGILGVRSYNEVLRYLIEFWEETTGKKIELL